VKGYKDDEGTGACLSYKEGLRELGFFSLKKAERGPYKYF